MSEPSLYTARYITLYLQNLYINKTVDCVRIIYTARTHGLENKVENCKLLPLDREIRTESVTGEEKDYEFWPSAASVLAGIMPTYIAGFIYCALVNSYYCEQNSRMNAMNQANKNANELFDELKFQFNSARKAAITQEITEISVGAKKQRQNRGVR